MNKISLKGLAVVLLSMSELKNVLGGSGGNDKKCITEKVVNNEEYQCFDNDVDA